MVYTIENELLAITVSTRGAETIKIVDKQNGRNLQWCGNSEVWNGHAPLLFPNTGRLTKDALQAKGKKYQGIKHGFAHDMEFRLVERSATSITLELRDSAETQELWPYEFVLQSKYLLTGEKLENVVTVLNPGDESLQFGMGFHPSFALPFDDEHPTEDYELRFDTMESPLCVDTMPTGLLSGKSFYLGRNISAIQLTDTLFDNDSLCMVNLQSKKIALTEKSTGRSITCSIEGFPYVLIWSAPTVPMRFICIEPWKSLPSEENGTTEWEKKPCAAVLRKGECFTAKLDISYDYLV